MKDRISYHYYLPVPIRSYKSPKCGKCDEHREISITAPDGRSFRVPCTCAEEEEEVRWMLDFCSIIGEVNDSLAGKLYVTRADSLGWTTRYCPYSDKGITLRGFHLDPDPMKPKKPKIKEANEYNMRMICTSVFSSWEVFERFCKTAEFPYLTAEQTRMLTDRKGPVEYRSEKQETKEKTHEKNK